MLAGHRAGRWCAQHKTLVYEKLCRKCPGFDKGETDVMLSWLCMTFIFHFWKYVTQGIKAPSENKAADPFHLSWVSLCHSFSLSSFFRLISWSAEALWVHFFARASKTLSRRRSVSSLHREGTCGLREQSKSCVRGFIGFLCEPRNISLFLSPLLSLSPTPFILRVSLDPVGAGPWY